MIELNYNLDTLDEAERQHACAFCRHVAFDMSMRMYYCQAQHDIVGGDEFWPNDCRLFDVPRPTASQCRTFAQKNR